MFLAHSAHNDIPVQSYNSHITGVIDRCNKILEKIKPHLEEDFHKSLSAIVISSAICHDLGKLCDFSQKILKGELKGKMPNHVDAGVAFLLGQTPRTKIHTYAAMLVYGHHIGMADYASSGLRDNQNILDRCPYVEFNKLMCDYTDFILPELKKRALSELGDISLPSFKLNESYSVPELLRLGLSILCDADHGDTASNYKNIVQEQKVELKSEKRREAIKTFISSLDPVQNKRLILRQELFKASEESKVHPFNYCAAVVGSGKTLATINFALKSNPERIIYVSPFIAITSQSAGVFKNIVLSGENPDHVVGENHSQIKIQSDRILEKLLAQTWSTPVVCTTIVQFIETLSSNYPSKLKKFHNIVGSHIIIDESHTIPVQFWPILLKQLEFLVEKMNCKVTFVSGTMSLPWENKQIKKIHNLKYKVFPMISDEFMQESYKQEDDRLKISYLKTLFKSPSEIYNFAKRFSGPKLMIFNTVKNAALTAKCFVKKVGKERVVHISTALTPADREMLLEKVRKRLKSNPNEDWYLIATSCIECGVDISFRHGFRELNGLSEILQAGGRVNRNLEYEDSQLIIFETEKGDYFTQNYEFITPGRITKDLFRLHGKIGASLSNEAFDKKLERGIPFITKEKVKIKAFDLMEFEKTKRMKAVADWVKVITDDKISVLVDESILDRPFTRVEIDRNSVQLYQKYIENKNPPVFESSKIKGQLVWRGKYNSLYGYLAEEIEEID